MKIPYFCCIGAELKRYAKDFDFMNQVYLYKVPTDDTIEEVLAQDYFQAISDTVLQDDLVYIYEASAETLHSCRFDKQNGHITAIPLASDETLTGAVTTIIHDNLTKNRAVISNNDGKIAVSEVTSTELGYLHGATSNIQTQLNNKASKDLDNLTSKGANIGNWSSNVTNCITEIPQDIKLELSNGTLTLKAGSKLYVPNGTGVFDEILTPADKTTFDSSIAFNSKVLMCYNSNNNTMVIARTDGVNNVGSGTLANRPAASSMAFGSGLYYATDENKLYMGNKSANTWTAGASLPIAIVSVESGTGCTSIDQVFNGFGYIGSTVFALPNVRFLIPNGMNEDGSLKNIESRIPSVQIMTNPDTNMNKIITINNNGTISQHNEWIVSKTRPTFREEWNQCWYNPDTNKVFFYRSATNNRFMETAFAISFSVGNDTRITDFTSKDVFHAVDYSDTDFIAHQAMPSDRYVDLTLPANGGSIIAPADGYIFLDKKSSDANQRVFLINDTGGKIRSDCIANISGQDLAVFVPCSKGDSVRILYDAGGTTSHFKFVYANGSK